MSPQVRIPRMPLSLQSLRLLKVVTLAAAVPLVSLGALAQDQTNVVDLGTQVPTSDAVKDSLFPEDLCKELKEKGGKCMGFAPAKRFVLPASTFKPGSAELPELLKKQLAPYAEAMRGRHDKAQAVRLEGHADASGPGALNESLSKRRAESAKAFLVSLGVDQDMLIAVGRGSAAPKVPQNPYAAENRRVEIARETPP